MSKIVNEHRWLPIADLQLDNEDVKSFLSSDVFSKLLNTEEKEDCGCEEVEEVEEPKISTKEKKPSTKDQKPKEGKKEKKSDYEIGHGDSLVYTADLNPHLVEEAKFYNFIPKKTLGSAIQEVRDNLIQIEKVIDKQIKLKTESGLQSGDYWKRTHKALTTIEERMTRISNKLKQIKG